MKKQTMSNFEGKVMHEKGYQVDPNNPKNVKYEVAKEIGIPLDQGYNGNITAKQAGKVGGKIGGSMVKEMIKIAEQSLKNK